MIDPAAPRPEGQLMTPVRGESTGATAQNHPRSLDSALHRYGTSAPKSIAALVLDHAGRPGQQITYGKLLSRANKVAFMLLNKTIASGKDNVKIPMCKAGDRVALIYPNTEPLAFLAAFYGCILAGVVPVPVEVPLTKRGLPKSTISSTSSLPKTTAPSGSSSLTGNSPEIVDLKSWPRLYWIITEHLAKPSRDWAAPPRVADESIAYIEYSCDREGAVKGVCISRQAMLAHCRAITAAMEYKQGLKTFPASVALVKSRDLHWGLLATRDHKDVNLSSLK
ncbi:unnamed protein product, partial [Strongylus vulgaris]